MNLPQNAYSKTEKTFLGWSLTPNGKVLKKYSLSEENITDNSIILYAIWK